MRRRRAQGQRADQDGDQEPEIALGPTAGHFHANGIDPRHAGAGDEAHDDDPCRGRLDQQDDPIGRRRGDRRDHEKPSRIDPVREPQNGADQGAEDEPDLHGAGIEGRLGGGQAVLGDQRRNHRRGRKPQRHDGNFAGR